VENIIRLAHHFSPQLPSYSNSKINKQLANNQALGKYTFISQL
jgi:hypothetical protein